MTSIATVIATRQLAEALRALDEADVESERVLLALGDPLTDDVAATGGHGSVKCSLQIRGPGDGKAGSRRA